MKNFKWITFLAMLVALVSAVPAQSLAQVQFSDVTAKDEYYEHVNYIAGKGIIQGYTENGKNLYKPANSISRYQIAKMLVVATNNENYNAGNITFKDVASGSDEHKYLSKAVSLGYFKQNADGSIKPHEYVKRAEMGYALAVAFNLSEKVTADKPLQLKDIQGHPDVDKLNGLYYAGVTQGSNGNFLPNSLLTRSQFAMFLARAMDTKFKLPVKQPGEIAGTFFVKVNTTGGDTLNVRSLPSMDGTVIHKLNSGAIVEVLERHGEWLRILVGGKTGYIYSSYTIEVGTEKPPVEPEKPAPTAKTIGKVTVNNLNVRASASNSAAVLTTLKTGQTVDVLSINGYWANIRVNSTTGYVHKSYLKLVNTTGNPLAGRVIVLDAGHGGYDPGTSANKLTEKSITLKVVNLVEAKLKRAGANVKMTRSTDTYVSLQNRTAFSQNNYAETFVSIHVNSATPTAKGTEVFYSAANMNAAESKSLAAYIQNNIVKQANMVDRKVKESGFYVIKNNNVAAVLVELGFISNKDDFAKLSSDKYLEIYAEAVYQGLVQYYSVK